MSAQEVRGDGNESTSQNSLQEKCRSQLASLVQNYSLRHLLVEEETSISRCSDTWANLRIMVPLALAALVGRGPAVIACA